MVKVMKSKKAIPAKYCYSYNFHVDPPRTDLKYDALFNIIYQAGFLILLELLD